LGVSDLESRYLYEVSPPRLWHMQRYAGAWHCNIRANRSIVDMVVSMPLRDNGLPLVLSAVVCLSSNTTSSFRLLDMKSASVMFVLVLLALLGLFALLWLQ